MREILCRLKTQGLPSHEQERKDGVKPGFRAVTGDERVLITLDGPCASGKTTLARKLAQAFEGAVVHTDDFVIPHAQKTPRRLAIPGGNCDADRLAREVAAPWNRGEPVLYRRYDCRKDVPRRKIWACSSGMKAKIKGMILSLFGVKAFCRLFGSGQTG